MTRFVSYLRVSTTKQGDGFDGIGGIGMEAQRQLVASYIARVNGKHVSEFVEVESGRKADRPQLAKALHLAKVTGSTLLVAKLDRLLRSLPMLTELRKSDVDFICADMPDANKLTISLLAAVAEYEAEIIGARTKAALAVVKQRGIKLGNPNGTAAIQRSGYDGQKGRRMQAEKAEHFAKMIAPVIGDIRASGKVSLQAISDELNARGILTARKQKWYPQTVRLLLKRVPVCMNPFFARVQQEATAP